MGSAGTEHQHFMPDGFFVLPLGFPFVVFDRVTVGGGNAQNDEAPAVFGDVFRVLPK